MPNHEGEKAIEKALSDMLPARADKSFAPPQQRGIHELIDQAIEDHESLGRDLEIIKKRLAEFDRLQGDFYNGRQK